MGGMEASHCPKQKPSPKRCVLQKQNTKNMAKISVKNGLIPSAFSIVKCDVLLQLYTEGLLTQRTMVHQNGPAFV